MGSLSAHGRQCTCCSGRQRWRVSGMLFGTESGMAYCAVGGRDPASGQLRRRVRVRGGEFFLLASDGKGLIVEGLGHGGWSYTRRAWELPECTLWAVRTPCPSDPPRNIMRKPRQFRRRRSLIFFGGRWRRGFTSRRKDNRSRLCSTIWLSATRYEVPTQRCTGYGRSA
jgi:hypothetical protein